MASGLPARSGTRASNFGDYARVSIEFSYHHARGDRTASEGRAAALARDAAALSSLSAAPAADRPGTELVLGINAEGKSLESIADPLPASGSAALFGGRQFGGCARNLSYRRHYLIRGSLLYHMAVSCEPMKPALGNVGVQPGRLGVDIDQLVIFAGDDDDGHL